MHSQANITGDARAPLAPSRSMRTKFMRELAELELPPAPGSSVPLTEADIADLPEPARRLMRFSGSVGRPRVWSLRAHATGVFRMRPSQPWMPAEIWQYDTSLSLARIFHMRMRLGGVVPTYVRDTYVHGRGRMLGRVLDRLSVVDQSDEKIHTGELVTYLNDAMLMAPSMALGPETIWSPVDEGSFDVALTDAGRTVRARVFVDERGAPIDFSTTDRFGTDPASPKEMVRAQWTTPVRAWTGRDGRAWASEARAVWHFASGAFAYGDFTFGEDALDWNVSPSSSAERTRPARP